MTVRPHQLTRLLVGDEPAAWEAAGFTVADGVVHVGRTAIVPVGGARGRGVVEAHVDGVTGTLDGLPFSTDPVEPAAPTRDHHPNGVVAIDHLVATSPDMDRTTAALDAAGPEPRRTRTFAAGGATRRQTFFWLGDVILELAGDDDAHGSGPAQLWGLALTCADLDVTAARLGDRLGPPKPAVQPGRRIATLRTRDLDISVPIVCMSPHPGSRG